MRKWIWLLSLFVLLPATVLAAGKALVLTVDDAINPATQDYIERGIQKAEKINASVVIIQLNTPGGLETSMRGINRAIIGSSVPVITYVMPSGARAASAGTFIMYASHVAAMAPGTNIGAASPVNLGGDDKSTDTKKLSTSDMKATNDAAAYIRSLAELRGRNADWAESAVRNATSISAEEAKKLNVIDEIAANQQQLLEKANGKLVLIKTLKTKINSANLEIEDMQPDWRSKFLSFITNPNIAYMLMLVAVYGLFFEFSNPGMVIPGVAGIIALLLALYAMQLMPVNYAGLALIIVGIGFMLAEVYISSFGVIGIGGVIAFIIGSIMLFDIRDAHYQLAWTLILTMSIITATFIFMVITLAINSQKKAVVTGKEGLVGSEGVVLSVMNEQVVVRVLGEIWEARSSHALREGEKIRVVSSEGLKLIVAPKRK